jgi:hypothetical protein
MKPSTEELSCHSQILLLAGLVFIARRSRLLSSRASPNSLSNVPTRPNVHEPRSWLLLLNTGRMVPNPVRRSLRVVQKRSTSGSLEICLMRRAASVLRAPPPRLRHQVHRVPALFDPVSNCRERMVTSSGPRRQRMDRRRLHFRQVPPRSRPAFPAPTSTGARLEPH